MQAINVVTLAILAGFAAIDVQALRVQDLRFPEVVAYGEFLTMSCIFELDGPDDVLYSVRWTKGQSEFYRYIMRGEPKKMIVPIDGVTVDAEKSGEHSVRIGPVSMESAGVYACEASVDAPSFLTAFARQNLTVVVPPAHKPNITGLEPVYDQGDVIRANCSSAPSVPPAEVRWLLNDVEVKPEFLKRPSSPLSASWLEPPKPAPNWLGIKLRVSKQLFGPREWLEIACESRVSSLPPLRQAARVRLWQPTAVPDRSPTAVLATSDAAGWSNDRLAQRSSPIKSGASDLRPAVRTRYLIILYFSVVTALSIIFDVS